LETWRLSGRNEIKVRSNNNNQSAPAPSHIGEGCLPAGQAGGGAHKKKQKMKKEKNIYNTYETPIRFSIQDVDLRKIIFSEKRKTSGALVPNHPTFGVAGGKLCNGPPGRARSPGVIIPDGVSNPVRDKTKTEPFPVLKGRPVKAKGTIRLMADEPFENTINTEYQLVINIKPKFQFITNI
jgi:hypothetical protein